MDLVDLLVLFFPPTWWWWWPLLCILSVSKRFGDFCWRQRIDLYLWIGSIHLYLSLSTVNSTDDYRKKEKIVMEPDGRGNGPSSSSALHSSNLNPIPDRSWPNILFLPSPFFFSFPKSSTVAARNEKKRKCIRLVYTGHDHYTSWSAVYIPAYGHPCQVIIVLWIPSTTIHCFRCIFLVVFSTRLHNRPRPNGIPVFLFFVQFKKENWKC